MKTRTESFEFKCDRCGLAVLATSNKLPGLWFSFEWGDEDDYTEAHLCPNCIRLILAAYVKDHYSAGMIKDKPE